MRALRAQGRGLLLAVVVLAFACDAKKKRSEVAGKSGECEDAKTVQQLIKRARKLTSQGYHSPAVTCARRAKFNKTSS